MIEFLRCVNFEVLWVYVFGIDWDYLLLRDIWLY